MVLTTCPVLPCLYTVAASASSCASFIAVVARNTAENKTATKSEKIMMMFTPFLSDARNRREAERIVLDHKEGISSVVNETLSRCGFTYGCNVRVGTEFFDERTYGDLTLPEGYYRAVIVELGSGEGKNWWCVAFPPLCFTLDEGYKNMQYKSILYEIVKKYLKREGK